MEIYYFGTNGEKIGPITKEELVKLAKAGAITEQTTFEINGQKVKGRNIKNLRPIFEEQKNIAPEPFPSSADFEKTLPPWPMAEESSTPLSPEDTNNSVSDDDFYNIAVTPPSQAENGTYSTVGGNSQNTSSEMYLNQSIARGPRMTRRRILDSSEPIVDDFWKSYGLFKSIIKIDFIFLAVILLLVSIGVLLGAVGGIISTKDEQDVVVYVVMIFLDIILTPVFCIMLYVGYRLILLPYYWMGSMVRSAEDTRFIKILLEEKLN